ncbi:MAG: UDP-3-O-(3-hydroxymyristoyl)glucosamine N-acyltransferase [Verrucomicrobia bacterium]|nr:UDP-3-O-(3-hydroxymyristoyl)glucosamine N-acyltransferase [Verrucomicrobiota bacterium]
MTWTAQEIAAKLGGAVDGDGSVIITGIAPAHVAREGELTFAENEAYFSRAEQSAAAAILADGQWISGRKPVIRVANARLAFAQVLGLFHPEPPTAPGRHPTAWVDESARIDPTAWIGPYCVVGGEVAIGPRSVLHGANHVADGCQIGEDVHLYPHVVLYGRTQIGHRVRVHGGTVIGADGFGYVTDQGIHRKVPQVGTVLIQDDVEIGANVTIDRGTLGPTVIGKGTKIDNLVQIGHNVVVGEHCLVVAQVGIAGSTRLGNSVTLAGQVGVAGHLRIGDRVVVAAQSGVMHHIPDGEKWLGAPACPDRQMKRQFIAIQQLPDLLRRFRELERRIESIEPQRRPSQNDG